MSTGHECEFVETKPNVWHYRIGIDTGFDIDWYVQEGPFMSFSEAYIHLSKHHANPGGFWTTPHPDSTDRSWE